MLAQRRLQRKRGGCFVAPMSEVTLRPFTAQDADWLIARHGELYARDEGFDDSFPLLVAEILDAFLANHDPERERGWIAWDGNERLGSIFCVTEAPEIAKLRLFLLVPEARGKGLGKTLLSTCICFARETGYRKMNLWTHESHRAACGLYASTGWNLIDSRPAHSFGVDVVEQNWTRDL